MAFPRSLAPQNTERDQQRHGSARKSLFLAFLLILSFMAVEAVGGWLTNSLALLSDAGHMLTDAGALGLSLLALRIGAKPPSATKTFGYRRFEILAALFNGLALWAIVGVILHEAALRLLAPPNIKAQGMIAVALVGLLVNLVAIRLLHAHKDESLNLRGAFLHVLADSFGSVGALAAGLLILATGWTLVDPLVSFAICALILWSSWGLVRDSVNLLLLGVPPHLDYQEIQQAILEHDGVCCIHDLHIWSVASGFDALSVHVVVRKEDPRQKKLLQEIAATLLKRFGIGHATIQLEESHEMKEKRIETVCRMEAGGRACLLPSAASKEKNDNP